MILSTWILIPEIPSHFAPLDWIVCPTIMTLAVFVTTQASF